MQDHDLKRTGLGLAQPLVRASKLRAANPTRLVAPGANRVEADHVERGGRVRRLGRVPLPLELHEGPGEASREAVGDVVISGNGKHWQAEAAQKAGRVRQLVLTPAVAQVSACDDELGLEKLDQHRRTALDRLVVACSEMEVRQV